MNKNGEIFADNNVWNCWNTKY